VKKPRTGGLEVGMDPLHVTIALLPLAMYLILLGAIHLSPRPFLTTGGRDLAALAVAVSGLIVVGPMELFLSESAAALYGGWVWVIMLTAYGLSVVLLALIVRPRLIVYNIMPQQLRPLVVAAAGKLDSEASWAGESLNLPQLGVQLHLEAQQSAKNVQLVSSGPQQNIYGWRRLELELGSLLAGVRTRPNRVGFVWILLGILAIGGITWSLAKNSSNVAQALNEMLRR
jgi:hypothetical protein